MSGIEWLYIITAVVAVIVTLIGAINVRVPARARWIRRSFFLLIAAVFLVVSITLPIGQHAKIIGYFITVLMLCFALWRQGLTKWGVIAGLGATRIWDAITVIDLTTKADKGVVLLEAYVGSIRVNRLTFKQDQAELVAFIQQHAPKTKISIQP